MPSSRARRSTIGEARARKDRHLDAGFAQQLDAMAVAHVEHLERLAVAPK